MDAQISVIIAVHMTTLPKPNKLEAIAAVTIVTAVWMVNIVANVSRKYAYTTPLPIRL